MAKKINIFTRNDIHPLVLDAYLFKLFGPEWVTWDPDSIVMAVERAAGTTVSRSCRNKIYGLSVLHANRAYWNDWRAFEAVSWALNGKQVDLITSVPLTPLATIYAYRCATLIDNDKTMSPEVQAYITAVFADHQFSLMPKDFQFLQDRLIQAVPHASARLEQVRNAVIAGESGAKMDSPDEDPVKVEVTRHRVLALVLGLVASKKFIIQQSEQYGVAEIVNAVLAGGNK